MAQNDFFIKEDLFSHLCEIILGHCVKFLKLTSYHGDSMYKKPSVKFWKSLNIAFQLFKNYSYPKADLFGHLYKDSSRFKTCHITTTDPDTTRLKYHRSKFLRVV